MSALKKQFKSNPLLIAFSILLAAHNVANAATDFEARESYLKARAMNHEQGMDQAEHAKHIEKHLDFHGVFYGFLPCNDCNGIKVTLSLKQNNNYLLVTQPARESSREFYEKGKYTWDEENHTVVLTPRNQTSTRQYLIQDEGTIVQLNENGKPLSRELAERYTLRRSDTVKSREVHIH